MSVGVSKFTFKRGDTFTVRVRFRPKQGGLQSLAGASVTSRVKDFKSSYYDLDCTLAEDGMSFIVNGDYMVTEKFATGAASWDARIEIGGTVIHTPTINFTVTSEITKSATAPSTTSI